jgi:hypothetical protein
MSAATHDCCSSGRIGPGYSSVWVADHLLPPSPYGPVYGGVFEQLTPLSYVATVTGLTGNQMVSYCG